jgi:hypothetical protein
MSPFTGPPEVRAAIRKCMEGNGYVLEKVEAESDRMWLWRLV